MASRALPVSSQDAQRILSLPVSISKPHQMRVCHMLRRTTAAHRVPRHEDASESVSHASISHLSRPILEAA